MYTTIKYLYPTATDDDFALVDPLDGDGPRLTYWNMEKLGPPPTAKALAQAKAPAALADAKKRKTKEMSAACQQSIFAGFPSAALGAVHTYPADETSQRNLIASVTASLLPGLAEGWTTPYWCADAAGVWIFQPHTVEQIRQVGLDCKAYITAALEKNAALATQIQAAASLSAIEGVQW